MTIQRATRTAHRYERTGVLAIDPTAFLEFFFCGPEPVVNEETPEASIVTIRGPLDQHAGSWRDSYEAILERVATACEAQPPAIVLKLDSPGGDAHGCFECAREIRLQCARAGKQLVAYVEGKAASAAYAIACAAGRVIMSDSAILGSIGVLATRPDYSAQNAARGFRMGFVASGVRKIDGHPDTPITEDELRAEQELVDSMASVFFELVAENRGVSVEAVAALQAGLFHGDAARAAGLGDETLTLRATLASLASWNEPTQGGSDSMTIKLKTEDKKPKEGEGDDEENSFDSIRSKLKQMSEGDDANAKAAKRALDALEKGEEPEATTDDPDEPEPAAAKEPTAATSSGGTFTLAEVHAIALAAEARAAKLEAKLKKQDDDAAREALIAQHPSLPKTMVALLRKSPLALVRETLKDFEPETPAVTPKPGKGGATAQQARAALQAGAKPTKGKHSQTGSGRVPVSGNADPEEGYSDEQIDRMMGMTSKLPKSGNVRNTAHKLQLGGPNTDEDEDESSDEADAALRAEAEAAGPSH